MTHGNYYRWDEIEKEAPHVISEWDKWLKANFDPGHYDAYKDKGKTGLWVCDTFMPKEIEEKLPERIRQKS